jgi:hypothetical protein
MVIVIGMSTTRRVVKMEIDRRNDSNEKGPEPGTGGLSIVRNDGVQDSRAMSKWVLSLFWIDDRADYPLPPVKILILARGRIILLTWKISFTFEIYYDK